MWWPFRSTPEPPCDWELIDKTVLPSPWEKMDEADRRAMQSMPIWLFQGAVVLTFKCKLSGRVKTITEMNP